MQIWPAIDLRGGKCVRLEQGDYRRETGLRRRSGRHGPALGRPRGPNACTWSISTGPATAAGESGQRARRFWRPVDVPCELGGGIRDEATIGRLLELGLSRLVIGTLALREPDWFRGCAGNFPAGSCWGSTPATAMWPPTAGWKPAACRPTELARQFDDEPLAAIIYTDIATDGMLAGPNLAAMREMQRGGAAAGDRLRRRDHGGRRGPAGRRRPWPAASSAAPCTKETHFSRGA